MNAGKVLLIICVVLIGIPVLACGGCLMLGVVINASMTPEQRERVRLDSEERAKANAPQQQWLTRVGERTDETGTLVLYSLDDQQWNNEQFKQLCLSEKKLVGDGFRFVAIFDKRENAKFPANPISAWYGVDFETPKHIVATYECTGFNSFSEATVYHPSNMMDGKRRKLILK